MLGALVPPVEPGMAQTTWLNTLNASKRNCSDFDSLSLKFFSREKSTSVKFMDRKSPIGAVPKPYPGPTEGEEGLTKHAGLNHAVRVPLEGCEQPDTRSGRL